LRLKRAAVEKKRDLDSLNLLIGLDVKKTFDAEKTLDMKTLKMKAWD
jgi:hypothetical protein